MTWANTRRQARRLLEALHQNQPPIDVHKIAAALKLDVIEADLGSASGLLITKGSISTICVQSSDVRERQRFTIAHEIGHHYLSHQREDKEHLHVNHGYAVSQRGDLSSQGIDPKEVEANQFAAELLMPAFMIRAEVEKYNLPLRERDVAILAQIFEVSEQAMGNRLRSLRFL